MEHKAYKFDWTTFDTDLHQVLIKALEFNNTDDVHELGDFALTRCYDPLADSGVGATWLNLDESLDQQCRNAMLGQTVGPSNNAFDPGRMGSYFQSPAHVLQSIMILRLSMI